MDVLRGYELLDHGSCRSSIYGDFRPGGEFDQREAVGGCQVDRHVPRNHGDGEHFEFVRRGECKEDGNRVVLARVGVDDD